MIKSMTGFGRSEKVTEANKIVVEMKAVNHRYCDLSIKIPKKLNYFEAAIRGILKEYVERGKVDVYITYEDYADASFFVAYNEKIAREYMENLEKISEEFGIDHTINAYQLSKYPDVFTLESQPVNEEEIWEGLVGVLREACEKFVETRKEEGEHLFVDLMQKLEEMQRTVSFIEERSPQIVSEYRAKLEERVKEFLENSSMEENRIVAEVALYADKVCVDEEIVRLKSHITSMMDSLREGGSIGRKLDFIAQEMNREANTILSKINNLEISNRAIDLKTEIEKVREQIQNIE